MWRQKDTVRNTHRHPMKDEDTHFRNSRSLPNLCHRNLLLMQLDSKSFVVVVVSIVSYVLCRFFGEPGFCRDANQIADPYVCCSLAHFIMSSFRITKATKATNVRGRLGRCKRNTTSSRHCRDSDTHGALRFARLPKSRSFDGPSTR